MSSTAEHPIRRLRTAAMVVAVALPVAAACAPLKSGAPPEVYARANQIRAQHGVGPLAPCPSLAAAAQRHANDMAARGSLGHQGSDGSWPADRLVASGYGSGFWGEIIADRVSTADGVLGLWAGSPRHAAILLDPAYRDVGFGYANGYWVGDFGAGGRC
ncbi:MAG TPA: CAP domain-containing protein [Acidimicrobiia bacterium]